ncbi:hypothetical protein A2379_03775 [Candidatus Amesbacteria bacterium RIFOXYB1_FULL_47_13]|nr:MAG: hypothetical protein A2379_03775 [Candidatus Amesbacteria bacterium RIFOXYB1_FULL_47_13]HBC73168.1 hypothetical protein [Candidatus Amesbacteria bacterium]
MRKSGWKGWILIILGSVTAVRTGMNVYRLWQRGGRVGETRQQLEAAKAENRRLQTKLEEVQTDEFVEKEAREKLGYGREGETVLILPKQDNAQGPVMPAGRQVLSTQEPEIPNWRKWWKLYVRL